MRHLDAQRSRVLCDKDGDKYLISRWPNATWTVALPDGTEDTFGSEKDIDDIKAAYGLTSCHRVT